VKEVDILNDQPADPERLQAGHLTEHSETQRLESAVEQISKMEQLRPEVWSQLTETQREWSLRHVGERLSHIYECPVPPVIASDLGKNAGIYSAPEYLARMDHQEFRSNDVYEALDTYCHEFRHAYQHEMADRYKSTFRHLCHDETAAVQWAENFRPGHYVEGDGYRTQPVEKDAWDFASKIVERVRGRQQLNTQM